MNPSRKLLAGVFSALLVLSVFGATVTVPTVIGSAGATTPLQPGSVSQCGTIEQSGTYTLADDINMEERGATCFEVRASGVVINGSGNSIFNGKGTAVRIQGTGDDPVRNVTVENLRVTVLDVGVSVSDARNVSVVDSEFESNNGTAIRIGATTGASVRDTFVKDNRRGIVLERGTTRTAIVDNDIDANRETGLTARNASHTTVRGNAFTGQTGDRTVYITGDSPDSRLEDNLVRGSNTGYGIYIDGTATNATLVDNVVRNNLQGGVRLVSDGNTLTDNVVRRNGVGLLLEDSSNNALRDNRVYRNTDWDYRSTDGSTGNAVTNLTLDEDNETVVSFDVSRDIALNGVREDDRPETPNGYRSTHGWVEASPTSDDGYVLLDVSYAAFVEENRHFSRERQLRLTRYDDSDDQWYNDSRFTAVDRRENAATAFVTDAGLFTPLYSEEGASAADLTPPTAAGTITPNPVRVGEEVTLDARAASDNVGVANYYWDVGNDGSVEQTGRTASRRFDSEGTRRVALTVTDRAGHSDTVVLTVRVVADSTDPTAVVEDGDRRVYTDSTVEFVGTDSYDDVGVASYEWAFGDGGTATGPVVEHGFADPSGETPYTVNLTVTDRAGNASSTTVDVTAIDPADDDVAPVADAGGDRYAVAGQSVTLDGSGSTDDVAIESYEWDVGNDGSVDATGETPSYTFTGNGTVEVALTVTDGGGNNHTRVVDVTVTGSDTQAPHADAGPDRRLQVGQTATFDGSGSTDDSGTVTSYKWAMGDGTVAYGRTVDHSYDSPGNYTVTLTVTDATGSVAAETTTVVVRSVPSGGAGSTTADTSTLPPANPTLARTDYPTAAEARATVENVRAGTRVRLGFDVERPQGRCHALEAVDIASLRPGDRTLTVRHLDEPDGETPAFDVEESGPAFGYIVVDDSRPASWTGDATFRFRVARSCLDDRGVQWSRVALYRHTGDGWERLDTTRQGPPVDGELTYAADSPGLSVLAVGTKPADRTEPTPTPTPGPGSPTATPTVTPTDGGEGPTPTDTVSPDGPTASETATDTDRESPGAGSGGQPGFGVAVALVALAAAALLATRRRDR